MEIFCCHNRKIFENFKFQLFFSQQHHEGDEYLIKKLFSFSQILIVSKQILEIIPLRIIDIVM